MTIVEFLMQRIAEDEAVGRDWSHINRGGGIKVDVCGGGTGYLAICNPDRVLAECAAKRRIVELHKFGPGYRQRQPWEPEWPQPEYVRDVCGECYEWDEDDDCASNAAAPCATIRTMAQVYSGHPDYRQEWA